ncbi:Uncharacterized protein CTYZ_00002116 [Cryptosporidium tyzzeri]|nr:Uncharacterized protein CTYZ_00002116 [Cryptosporidium tyzzeri]
MHMLLKKILSSIFFFNWFFIIKRIEGIDLNDDKEILIRELGIPLRMKPFGENRVPSLRNFNYKTQGENNNYRVEINNLYINDRFQLSYYLKISDKDTKFLSCSFKFRFNNTTLPMLVNRGEVSFNKLRKKGNYFNSIN